MIKSLLEIIRGTVCDYLRKYENFNLVIRCSCDGRVVIQPW